MTRLGIALRMVINISRCGEALSGQYRRLNGFGAEWSPVRNPRGQT